MIAPPPELTATVPRRTRLRPVAYVLLILAFALALGVPAILVDSAWRSANLEKILTARGAIATGRVVSKSDTTSPKDPSRHAYRIDFEYSAPGSPWPFSGHDWIDQARYYWLTEGGPVEIIFDPNDPSTAAINYPERSAVQNSKIRRSIMALPILLLLAGTIAASLVRPIIRQRQLLRWGLPAQARIIDVQKKWRRGGASVVLIYHFHDTRDVEIEGRSELPLSFLQAIGYPDFVLKTGWSGPYVLFDAENSGRNVLYAPNLLVALNR